MFDAEDELDWETVPDGYEKEGITSLIDNGFQTVPEYRRDRGIMDSEMRGEEGWDLTRDMGEWRQMKPARATLQEWEPDRDRIYIHEAEYATFQRYGCSWCKLRITASAENDVDPATGTRLEEADGRRGHIRITSILPEDTDLERYVEQYLNPDA